MRFDRVLPWIRENRRNVKERSSQELPSFLLWFNVSRDKTWQLTLNSSNPRIGSLFLNIRGFSLCTSRYLQAKISFCDFDDNAQSNNSVRRAILLFGRDLSFSIPRIQEPASSTSCMTLSCVFWFAKFGPTRSKFKISYVPLELVGFLEWTWEHVRIFYAKLYYHAVEAQWISSASWQNFSYWRTLFVEHNSVRCGHNLSYLSNGHMGHASFDRKNPHTSFLETEENRISYCRRSHRG